MGVGDYLQNYARGMAMQKNPALLKQYLADQEASKMASMAQQLYGKPGQAAVPQQMQQQTQPMEGPLQPGQQRGSMQVNQEIAPAQAAVQGTKMYNESVPLQQRMTQFNQDLLGSGLQGLAKQWSGNQANMQNSNMSAIGSMARQVQGQQNAQANPSLSTAGKMAKESGYQPGTQAFQNAVKNYMKKSPSTNISVNGGAKPYSIAETRVMEVPDPNKPGEYKPLARPMTPDQFAAAGGRIKPKSVTATDAIKQTGLNLAAKNFKYAREQLIGKDGVWNEDIVRQLSAQVMDPTNSKMFARGSGYAKGPSQRIFGGMSNGLRTMLRIETGAAATTDEVNEVMTRFMPLASDATEERARKLAAYEYMISNTASAMNPNNADMSKISGADLAMMMNAGIDRAFEAVDSTQPAQPAQPATNRAPAPGENAEFDAWLKANP